MYWCMHVEHTEAAAAVNICINLGYFENINFSEFPFLHQIIGGGRRRRNHRYCVACFCCYPPPADPPVSSRSLPMHTICTTDLCSGIETIEGRAACAQGDMGKRRSDLPERD